MESINMTHFVDKCEILKVQLNPETATSYKHSHHCARIKGNICSLVTVSDKRDTYKDTAACTQSSVGPGDVSLSVMFLDAVAVCSGDQRVENQTPNWVKHKQVSCCKTGTD